jgi:hypothetical protein
MLLPKYDDIEPPLWRQLTSTKTNCCFHCLNGTTLFDFLLDIMMNIDGHLNCEVKSETNDLIVEFDSNNNSKNVIDTINSHYERIINKNQ